MGRGAIILGILAVMAGAFWFYNERRESLAPQEAAPVGTIKAQMSPWTEYTAPLGQFKVLLPSHPHHSRVSHDNKDYEIFLSPQNEGTLYSINLISFPEKEAADAAKDPQFLEKALSEMLKSNPQNEIKDMRKGQYQNAEAFDFTVASQGLQIKGKAFLVGNTLYVLSTSTPDGGAKPQEFDFFIKSFQLKTSPAAVPAK